MEGWIKSYRAMLENPIVCKDADHYAVWGYLLHNAKHAAADELFNGKRITLHPGQLITGRKKIADHFKIDESKVQRILQFFENERQIERQTGNKSSLISILNWENYQSSEQQNALQLNGNCTTDEQQLNGNCTASEHYIKNERIKEGNNDKNEITAHTHNSFQVNNFSSRVQAQARELLDWVTERFPDIAGMPEPINETQAVWLVRKYDVEDLRRLMAQMHNKGVANSGLKNAYSTLTSYIGNDVILKEKKRNGANALWNQQNAEAINRGYLRPRPTTEK